MVQVCTCVPTAASSSAGAAKRANELREPAAAAGACFLIDGAARCATCLRIGSSCATISTARQEKEVGGTGSV